MKKDLLFPNRYRRIGWLLFIPCALAGLFAIYDQSLPVSWTDYLSRTIITNSFADEVAALGVLLGLLFIAFAREKSEDEMIRQLRLESLQWSVYANYLLLALAIVFIYDMAFFNVLVCNLFTILLVFIVRFRWSLKRGERTDQLAA